MADTWTPQKRKQNAPLGAPPSAVDQLAFNAVKELTPNNLPQAYTLASSLSKLAGGAAFPLSNLVTAYNLYDKFIAGPTPTGQYKRYSGDDVEDQGSETISQAPVSPEVMAALDNSVGDYGVSDLPGTYEENVQKAINESFARAASQSNKAEAAKQSKVDQALMEAISNEIGDYEASDVPSTEPVGSIKSAGWDALGNKMQGIIDQNALNAQAGAIPGNYSPATSNISKTIESPIDDTVVPNPFADIPTTVPMTIDLSSVFNPATANDKDGDLGRQAPAGGYQSYSGEDVEASYSVPDSKPSGQSSGNWNTTSRQVSTTPSDSGGSSGGK